MPDDIVSVDLFAEEESVFDECWSQELVPGERPRAYPPNAADYARRCADLLEAAVKLTQRYRVELCDTQDPDVDPDEQDRYDGVLDSLARVRRCLTHQILLNLDLVGLEHRDEHGRVFGIIRIVLDPDMDAPEPLDPCVKYERGSYLSWLDWQKFAQPLAYGWETLRLPGSKLTGYQALIEAARTRSGRRAP